MAKPETSEIRRPFVHLKLPTEFDFDVSNLAHSWKRWRKEVELYMELAMVGKKEETIVKLSLYIVGSQGREIYETLSFDQEHEKRSFKDIVEAFSNYCDPKKNETIERYKFVTRVQEAREKLDKFITDVKILAPMCSFEQLKESLIRDRIICDMTDSKLRQDLSKIPELSLDKCIENCCLAKLSKERSKEIEDNARVYAFNAGQGGKQNRSRKVRHEYNSKQLYNAVGMDRKCKYCGGMHEWNKTKCPAYGKECRKCHKLNHFASVCKTKRQTVKKADTSSDSSDYEEIKKVKVIYKAIYKDSCRT